MTDISGGVTRGYWVIGSLVIAKIPAIVKTMAMTIANRGLSTKTRENVFIWSIEALIDSFIGILLLLYPNYKGNGL